MSLMTPLIAVIHVIFVSVFIVSTGTSALAKDNGTYFWAANNPTIDELPSELERFGLVLHNLGALPLRTFQVNEFDERNYRDLFLAYFPAFDWTDALDNIFCDLNPSVCQRNRREVSSAKLVDLSSHVGGYALTPSSQSSWADLKGKTVTLPYANLRTRANWSPFALRKGARGYNVLDVYNSFALGCLAEQAYDSPFLPLPSMSSFKNYLRASDPLLSCPRLIANRHVDLWTYLRSLNQDISDGRSPEKLSELYSDVVSVVTSVSDATDAQLAWRNLSEGVASIYKDQNEPVVMLWLPVFSVFCEFQIADGDAYASESGAASVSGGAAWRKFLKTQTDADRMAALERQLGTLYSSVSAEQTGSADSAANSTPQSGGERGPIYNRLVDGVFAPLNYTPVAHEEGSTAAALGEFPHSVVIVDDGVARNHCVFSRKCSSTWVDRSDLDKPAESQRVMFDAIKKEIRKIEEDGENHGLGVAAIAAAKTVSGVMEGLDREAKLMELPLNLEQWDTSRFADRAQQLMRDNPGIYTVWNISGHTEDRNQAKPIYRFLSDPINRRMQTVVVAAGNVSKSLLAEDREFKECSIYPACGVRAFPNNIVAVVGARIGKDGVPELWTDDSNGKTSYGFPEFQIAAIAGDVVVPSATTTAFYSLSGTSYATPQVAAVVSRIRAQMRHRPENIVARLIACGRQSTKLIGYVAGGLMDVDCSVLTDKVQVAFEAAAGEKIDQSVAKKLRPGRLLGIWRESDEEAGNIQKADTIDIGRGEDYDITGWHQWWAKSGYPSILGYRQFVGDPDKFKLVVWNRKNEIKAEARDRLKSSHHIEVKFDGDEIATCISVEKLIAFIPAADTMVSPGDHINASESTCKNIYRN